MELRQLETFRTIAQTLSFSQAAASLNYAQSTVSAQIQSLEEELGVQLFDRLGKHVGLTEAGKRLLGYADKVLALTNEARIAVSEDDLLSGSLIIRAPETLCTYRLPALLRQFRDRYPQIQLMFRPYPMVDLQRSFREGTTDVAFLMAEPLQISGLSVEFLRDEPLLVVTHPHHPLVQCPSVGLTDLQREVMILTEPECGYRRVFEQALSAAGVGFMTPPMEFHSIEAIKQCVMAGIGISFLPEVAVEIEVAQGRLATLNWSGRDFSVATQMVWHKDKWLSPALRAFLEMTRGVLRTARVGEVA